MLNLRSRRNKVTIGGVDVSAVVISVEITDSQWDETSGLKKAAGTLRLSLATPGFALDFDPRTNPTLWAKGQVIKVDVENMAGNLVRHPRGYLHLLRVPKVPTFGDTEMELSIGCPLTLNDWRQPAGDNSGSAPGSNVDTQDVISAIAQSINLPALQTPIPGALSGPQPQLGGGYVAQMGTIAAAAGYVLYIDGQGALRAKRPDPKGTASVQMVVNRDAQVWERSESQEAPVEVVKAHSTAKVWKRTAADGPKRVYSYSSTRDYDPSEISETTFNGFGDSDSRTGSTQYVQQPMGIVFNLSERSPSFIPAIIEDKYTYYDASSGFKRLDEVVIKEPLGKIYPSKYPKNTTPWVSKEIYTRYFYENLATKKIVESTYEPSFLVDRKSTSISTTLSSVKTTEWVKYGSGWLQIERSRDIKNGTTNTTLNYSGSGNAQPPAPDRAPDEWAAEDKLIECEAKFPSPGPANLYPRDKIIEFPTATQEQLCMLAQLVGEILQAKNYPVSWASDMRDSELAGWEPLRIYQWDDGREIGNYLAVGQSWTITQTQAVTAIDAYQTQRLPRPTPLNPTPTLIPLWRDSTSGGGYLALFGQSTSFAALPIESTVGGGYLALFGEVGEWLGGYAALTGSIISIAVINFDEIVVNAAGEVVTSNGFVVTTTGNPVFNAIVVNAAGEVVTSNGFVVTTTGEPAFDAIAVDAAGRVITSGGFVVYTV
jgi:hypothetical protein